MQRKSRPDRERSIGSSEQIVKIEKIVDIHMDELQISV
jgi:hypothetical protein